jgi:hypothetical protein
MKAFCPLCHDFILQLRRARHHEQISFAGDVAAILAFNGATVAFGHYAYVSNEIDYQEYRGHNHEKRPQPP